MARKTYDLTPEEARNWRLARLFDLRSFIGCLFIIFGVLVIIPGFFASDTEIANEAGINLNYWVGGIMLAIGIFFTAWVLLKPPEPITAAEAEAARKMREEFGTSSAGH